MIISKRKLDVIVEKAVNDAIKENNAYREKMEHERYLDGRFDSLNKRIEDMASEIYKDIGDIRDDISDKEEALWRKINDIECRISHKKKE